MMERPQGAELRAAVYRGGIFSRPANKATFALVREARALLTQELGEAIEMAQHRMAPDAHFLAIGRVRRALLEERFLEHLRAILAELDLDIEGLAIDRPRLRAVLDHGHENPAAAAAYFAHRDTWYANPASQLNFWIPLSKVEASETFLFYPGAFEVPVANDSGAFDWAYFGAHVGWQAPSAPAGTVYPRALESLERWAPLELAASAGDLIIFSGAHLHQTRAHTSGRTRFSLDFRAVYLPDHQRGLGAPNVDNASRGSTLSDFVILR